jgi:hypothetical protein
MLLLKLEFNMSPQAPYIVSPQHRERPQAEDFIKTRYATCYGANISHFPERLLVLRNAAGEIAGCCGLRDAQEGFISALYVEDGDLAAHISTTSLDQLWEFTTLAASDRQSLFAIIQSACDFGRQAGKTAAIFTTTNFICRFLEQRGVNLVQISNADERNAPSPGPWGTYYSGGASVYLVPDTLNATGHFARRSAPTEGAHAA